MGKPMDFRIHSEAELAAWRAAVIATLVNSALYLSAVFVAAIVDYNLIARNVCICAMGATYLSYLIQIGGKRSFLGTAVIVVSIVLGAAAGLALLF